MKGLDTYHTPPMPGGWLKQYEIAKLADARTGLEYSIPVSELQGLGEGVGAAAESLAVSLEFGREQGLPAVDLTVNGAVVLTCQRCLRPMHQAIAVRSRVVLLENERDADRAPGSLETFLATEGRVSAVALVSEEVLLALPIAPCHEDAAQCTDVAPLPATDGGAEQTETQRPFADLRALLKNRQE